MLRSVSAVDWTRREVLTEDDSLERCIFGFPGRGDRTGGSIVA